MMDLLRYGSLFQYLRYERMLFNDLNKEKRAGRLLKFLYLLLEDDLPLSFDKFIFI